MNTSIKSVSATQIQDAIAKVLSEFTGNTCEVFISEMQFEVSTLESFIGGETFTFTAKTSLKPISSDEKLPF